MPKNRKKIKEFLKNTCFSQKNNLGLNRMQTCSYPECLKKGAREFSKTQLRR